MYGSSWDENTGESTNGLFQVDLASGESKQLPVEIDENSSIQYMDADADGNLIMVVSRYVQIGTDMRIQMQMLRTERKEPLRRKILPARTLPRRVRKTHRMMRRAGKTVQRLP